MAYSERGAWITWVQNFKALNYDKNCRFQTLSTQTQAHCIDQMESPVENVVVHGYSVGLRKSGLILCWEGNTAYLDREASCIYGVYDWLYCRTSKRGTYKVGSTTPWTEEQA